MRAGSLLRADRESRRVSLFNARQTHVQHQTNDDDTSCPFWMVVLDDEHLYTMLKAEISRMLKVLQVQAQGRGYKGAAVKPFRVTVDLTLASFSTNGPPSLPFPRNPLRSVQDQPSTEVAQFIMQVAGYKKCSSSTHSSSRKEPQFGQVNVYTVGRLDPDIIRQENNFMWAAQRRVSTIVVNDHKLTESESIDSLDPLPQATFPNQPIGRSASSSPPPGLEAPRGQRFSSTATAIQEDISVAVNPTSASIPVDHQHTPQGKSRKQSLQPALLGRYVPTPRLHRWSLTVMAVDNLCKSGQISQELRDQLPIIPGMTVSDSNDSEIVHNSLHVLDILYSPLFKPSRVHTLYISEDVRRSIKRWWDSVPGKTTPSNWDREKAKMPRAAYIQLVLDLVNLLMPCCSAKHDTDMAESDAFPSSVQWLDFETFYQAWFEWALIFIRGEFPSNDTVVAFYDTLHERIFKEDTHSPVQYHVVVKDQNENTQRFNNRQLSTLTDMSATSVPPLDLDTPSSAMLSHDNSTPAFSPKDTELEEDEDPLWDWQFPQTHNRASSAGTQASTVPSSTTPTPPNKHIEGSGPLADNVEATRPQQQQALPMKTIPDPMTLVDEQELAKWEQAIRKQTRERLLKMYSTLVAHSGATSCRSLKWSKKGFPPPLMDLKKKTIKSSGGKQITTTKRKHKAAGGVVCDKDTPPQEPTTSLTTPSPDTLSTVVGTPPKPTTCKSSPKAATSGQPPEPLETVTLASILNKTGSNTPPPPPPIAEGCNRPPPPPLPPSPIVAQSTYTMATPTNNSTDQRVASSSPNSAGRDNYSNNKEWNKGEHWGTTTTDTHSPTRPTTASSSVYDSYLEREADERIGLPQFWKTAATNKQEMETTPQPLPPTTTTTAHLLSLHKHNSRSPSPITPVSPTQGNIQLDSHKWITANKQYPPQQQQHQQPSTPPATNTSEVPSPNNSNQVEGATQKPSALKSPIPPPPKPPREDMITTGSIMKEVNARFQRRWVPHVKKNTHSHEHLQKGELDELYHPPVAPMMGYFRAAPPKTTPPLRWDPRPPLKSGAQQISNVTNTNNETGTSGTAAATATTWGSTSQYAATASTGPSSQRPSSLSPPSSRTTRDARSIVPSELTATMMMACCANTNTNASGGGGLEDHNAPTDVEKLVQFLEKSKQEELQAIQHLERPTRHSSGSRHGKQDTKLSSTSQFYYCGGGGGSGLEDDTVPQFGDTHTSKNTHIHMKTKRTVDRRGSRIMGIGKGNSTTVRVSRMGPTVLSTEELMLGEKITNPCSKITTLVDEKQRTVLHARDVMAAVAVGGVTRGPCNIDHKRTTLMPDTLKEYLNPPPARTNYKYNKSKNKEHPKDAFTLESTIATRAAETIARSTKLSSPSKQVGKARQHLHDLIDVVVLYSNHNPQPSNHAGFALEDKFKQEQAQQLLSSVITPVTNNALL